MNSLTYKNTDFSELKSIAYLLWDIVKNEMFGSLRVEEKSGHELVTHIDRLVETKARELIKKEFWNINFKWEEFPDEDNGSEITCIIDPLDGTESFINREFNTTISIWIERWWKLIYGIVYDFMKGILYEWSEKSRIYFKNKEIPLLRESYSQQSRVLISWRGNELYDLETRLRAMKNIRVTRAYGSVALQIVQTWVWNYDGYLRSGKVKQWDIAGWTPFIHWLDDTEIFSNDGSSFNYKSPESGLIVVRWSFKNQFQDILEL